MGQESACNNSSLIFSYSLLYKSLVKNKYVAIASIIDWSAFRHFERSFMYGILKITTSQVWSIENTQIDYVKVKVFHLLLFAWKDFLNNFQTAFVILSFDSKMV